ncbi:unnamed protein product, partial [Mesorhabditis belari]|uniref:Uncharacterized protein n=1 Tax=Mesorhabditis belari TaxID=2138241 RepID=A0AAF3EGL3_9BILA
MSSISIWKLLIVILAVLYGTNAMSIQHRAKRSTEEALEIPEKALIVDDSNSDSVYIVLPKRTARQPDKDFMPCKWKLCTALFSRPSRRAFLRR